MTENINISVYDRYLSTMQTVRERFNLINQLKLANNDKFFIAETCAFHGRKIVEGIVFGCLIAVENGIGLVPRKAKGQYNAEVILKLLERKNFGVAFPSPSIIRNPTLEEANKYNATVTIEGQPQKRMSRKEFASTYARLHRWNHELNPYVEDKRLKFLNKYEAQLWQDLDQVWGFIEKHVISINGKAFFCVLNDNVNGQVKLISLMKERDI